jgi:hypothetical protein
MTITYARSASCAIVRFRGMWFRPGWMADRKIRR